MAIATRRPRGGGDGNGLGLLRSSVERRRIANAKITARRQRMWEDARLQRQEEEKRAALHILERRKKERARLSSYIYSAIPNHHHLKFVSEGSIPLSVEGSHKSAPFKQKARSSAEISTRNSRLGGGASSKCASEEGMVKDEHAARTCDADRSMPHIQDTSSGMENSKPSDTVWKSKAGAILCKAKENMKDNTDLHNNTNLHNVEACTPFSGKNTNMHMPLVENNDLANETFMVKHRERQINHSSVKDCENMKSDGGLCFHGEHTEMLVMDASMNIKPSSRSTLHSRKSFSTSLLSSESSQSKKSDQLPPVKHVSALAYRKDKRLILQSLRNRQKKNLLNLSEKEKSLLASIERLDVKLASTKGDSSSISMISDENSVKSAPTVMERLGSRQGSKPWKILRHPLRPLSSLSAALPLKRRQNVGLTNKSRQNTNCCSRSSEPKECQSSFLGPQLEAVQPAIGTIHIHQDPRFLLSP